MNDAGSRQEQIESHRDRVLILRNRKAGSGQLAERLDQVVKLLGEAGLQVELISDPRQLGERTRQLLDQGVLRCVVAAGGDGTAELVVNQTPPGTPMAVFPLGTENLLARYLTLTATPSEFVEVVTAGRVARLDSGLVRTAGQPDRVFLLMMGCGFDAEVVHRLHHERRGHINYWSYAKPILDSIRSYNYPPMRISCHERLDEPPTEVIEANFAFVFNIPSYAAGLSISPDADPFDGNLDVATFEGTSFWHGLFHLSAIFLGQHRNLQGVRESRARVIRIEADSRVPFQLDGDPGGHLPVEIETQTNRLCAVVPRQWKEWQ